MRDVKHGQSAAGISDTDLQGVVGGASVPMLDAILSEIRTEPSNTSAVRKMPGMHKVGDITLKRG